MMTQETILISALVRSRKTRRRCGWFFWLSICLVIFALQQASAATLEVTFASVIRPMSNDDGSVYDPTPGSVVWQCIGTQDFELVQGTADLQQSPFDPAAVGNPLSMIFAGQPDGTYTCVAREQPGGSPPLRSNPSVNSETVSKAGAVFLVSRVVPNAPSGAVTYQ